MTMEQLSAYTVKIQIPPEELQMLIPPEETQQSTEQMQRMLVFLLTRAESFSGIPFRSSKVTVELLPTQEGGAIVYLTAKLPSAPRCTIQARSRAAAMFADEQTLRRCCAALQCHMEQESSSSLYRVKGGWLLILSRLPANSRIPQHFLQEFGQPCVLSPPAMARLEEYGECVCRQDAIAWVASKK